MAKNIIQTFPAGAGSGHTILDGDGTAMAQEKNLQFSGLSVTDDSTQGVTEVAPAQLNEDSLNDVCNGSIGTNFVTPSANYSTNEQIIGRWIDGKPIYQKTFTSTLPSSPSTIKDISISSLNIETVTNIMGMMKGGSGTSTSFRTIGVALGSGSQYTDGADIWINITSDLRFRTNVSSWCNNTVYITIQYTKTTD